MTELPSTGDAAAGSPKVRRARGSAALSGKPVTRNFSHSLVSVTHLVSRCSAPSPPILMTRELIELRASHDDACFVSSLAGIGYDERVQPAGSSLSSLNFMRGPFMCNPACTLQPQTARALLHLIWTPLLLLCSFKCCCPFFPALSPFYGSSVNDLFELFHQAADLFV